MKTCDVCHEIMLAKVMRTHMRRVHNIGKPKTQKCTECHKTYSFSNLKNHINHMHKRIMKTCDVCNEIMLAKVMPTHMTRVHNIGKLFKNVTPRGPNRKSGLRGQPLGTNENIILIRNKKIEFQ